MCSCMCAPWKISLFLSIRVNHLKAHLQKNDEIWVDFSVNFQSWVDFLLIFPKNKIVTGKDDILGTKFAYIKAIYHWMCLILLGDRRIINVNAAIFGCISAISFIHNFQNLKFHKLKILKIWGGLLNIFEISSWFCKCALRNRWVVTYKQDM